MPEEMSEYQKEIKDNANLKAEVIRTTGMIIVRDVDELTTMEEVEDAIRKEIGDKTEISVRLRKSKPKGIQICCYNSKGFNAACSKEQTYHGWMEPVQN